MGSVSYRTRYKLSGPGTTHHVVCRTDKLPIRSNIIIAVQHNLALGTPEAVLVISVLLHHHSSLPDGLMALAAFTEGGLEADIGER